MFCCFCCVCAVEKVFFIKFSFSNVNYSVNNNNKNSNNNKNKKIEKRDKINNMSGGRPEKIEIIITSYKLRSLRTKL